MRHLRQFGRVLLMSSWWFLSSGILWAEAGILVVHVEDVQQHPISGVEIGVKGDGGTAVTGDDGKARISLAGQTRGKGWVLLEIVRSPAGRDFEMVSPWDHRAAVPSFENESENFVEVVVVQRGDRAALASGTVLASLAAQIIKANALKTTDKPALQENPKADLAAVATQYGLTPDDLDQAIRDWGVKATDPYKMGLVALYQHDYPKASTLFAESLQKREGTAGHDDVAEAAWFLGQSLYEEGKYRESATAFQRSLPLRPDDGVTLNNLALSLTYAEDYTAAEPLYRRALAIQEKALGPDDPRVATCLNNLALLLHKRGDYEGAEPLYRRALAIDEKALGPDHPNVSMNLKNLVALLRAKGDYTAAEPLARRALAIDEKALGPNHPDVAKDLNDLADLLHAENNDQEAAPLYGRALAIDEKTLGPDDLTVGADLTRCARMFEAVGENEKAEAFYRRGLVITEKDLGPENATVASALNNLAGSLLSQGNYDEAIPLCRRALTIYEKVLKPDDPDLATGLNNFAGVLKAKGDYRGAEPLYRRALAIREKVLGPDHPATQRTRRNLEFVTAMAPLQKPEK